jgi:RNA polymerase sigma-70 factor (ECF subfamily)
MTLKEYNQCVDLHANNIFRFLVKQIRDKDTAKDLVQDAFERLWLNLNEVSFEKGKSFLYTVAYRRMLDILRKKREHYLEERPDFDHPDQWRDYNNLKDIMDKALETLPLQQKSLVLLRDYEDYAYKDIAEITGLSESQVKVYLFRARKALKDYLVKINFKEA